MFHKLLWYSLAALRGAIVWWALWIECVPSKTKWLSVTIHDHNMRINLFNSPHPLPCHSTPGDHRVILAVILSPLLAGHECNERPGVQQTSPEWIMSLIMRYRYCPSVDMNTFSVLQCVCDHEMNRSEEEEVAELPSNSSFSIVGSIVSFVVTLYFIFPPLESRRTHRRTITMWIWWYYGKREEINSNWINSYEGIHRTESRSFI